MATPGEIAAMDAALEALRIDTERIRAAVADAPLLSLEIGGQDADDYAATVYAERIANIDRFGARRNELAASDDHEAILAFVEGIKSMVAADLASGISRASSSSSLATILGDGVKGALSDLKIGGLVAMAVVGIVLFIYITKE